MPKFVPLAAAIVLLSGAGVACTAPASASAVYCDGHRATIVVGARSARTVVGTSRNDVIAVTSGLHEVLGGAGNDIMCADSLGSTLVGGAGNDVLIGGAGADTLIGGTGNDLLEGQNGNDALSGQGGDDTLEGGSGTNHCDRDAADVTTQGCTFDWTPPVITGFQVLTPQVDMTAGSDTVRLQLEAGDDSSGVHDIWAQFCGPNGEENSIPPVQFFRTSGTALSGEYQATAQLSPHTPNGTWRVCAANASDNALNQASYFPNETAVGDSTKSLPAGIYTFNVINDQAPDTTAPTITDITVTPKVDVTSAAETVTAEFTATEEASGFNLISFVLIAPSSGSEHVEEPAWQGTPQLIAPATNGVSGSRRYRAIVSVPAGSPPGEWTAQVTARDVQSNLSQATRLVEVDNSDPITSVPDLVSGSLTAGATARTQAVTLHVTSARAQVLGATVHVDGPNGQQTSTLLSLTSGTSLDGVWTGTIQLPDAAAAGAWQVNDVVLRDSIGRQPLFVSGDRDNPDAAVLENLKWTV